MVKMVTLSLLAIFHHGWPSSWAEIKFYKERICRNEILKFSQFGGEVITPPSALALALKNLSWSLPRVWWVPAAGLMAAGGGGIPGCVSNAVHS